MIKNFLHDVMTELGAIFGDRGVLLIMGVAVIFYAFVYPLPYAREVLRKVPLVVIDHDNSASEPPACAHGRCFGPDPGQWPGSKSR
jgi:ABC-2 type transport system permease protein